MNGANTDGAIIIGTVVDDSEFYKKIKEYEKVKDFSVEIDPELNVDELQKQIIEANEKLQKYKNVEIMSKDDLLVVQELIEFIDKANERISELGGQKVIISGLNDAEESAENIKDSLNKIDLSRVEKQLNSMGKSIEKVTKKIGKMALAVFGIRSAFMFVRNAINTISGDDEQLKADIDYMKNALAYTLEPVVRKIVDWARQLMFYIGYIIKMWTGKNIFENANKGLQSANKEAKKLNKTLSGFDEMNVLSDTSSSAGGTATPSFDLGEGLPQGEVPGWLDFIVKNKDEIIATLFGVAGGILAVKLGFELLTATGIGLIISGIYLTIKGIVKFIKDPSWSNFLTILEGIALVVAGIALLLGGWVVALVALGVAIVAYVIKNWEEVKKILGEVGDWIYDNIIKPIGDFFVNLWNGIKSGVGDAVQWVKEKFKSVVDFFSSLITKVISLFKTIGTKVGDAISGAFKAVVNGVLKAIENILNFPIRQINKLIDVINKVPGINIGTLSTFNLPRLAKGGILNNPGRGVPVGGAIAGEAGREFYMPLQDEQMLNMVGQAIGKYITINANITTTMNGRVINRELQKVQNESNFAYNR